MDGFKQIKSFYSWVFNNPDKVRPTHISLYLFLWNQNNRSNWVEWFKCPYDLAMQGACIGSKGTYYKCLDQLTEWKLIEYKKGLNNYKAPQVKLIRLYNTEQVTEQVTVPLSGQASEPLNGLLTGKIYNLETVNHKLVNKHLVDWLSSVPSDESEKKFNFRTSLLDYGFKEQLVNDWLLVRKKKSATNSETAFTKFINQVELSTLDKDQILEVCIEKDWKAFNHAWKVEVKPQKKSVADLQYEHMMKQINEHGTDDTTKGT